MGKFEQADQLVSELSLDEKAADENFPLPAVEALRRLGHNCIRCLNVVPVRQDGVLFPAGSFIGSAG